MDKNLKKELEKSSDKISFLKKKLSEYNDSETRRLLIEEIKKKGLVKLSSGEPAEYTLIYDSFSEGLEPIYFWVLDFMTGSGPGELGFKVTKTEEAFEASASSGYYGEIGSRASIMQDRAMKIMQTINTVVRSIINLIYDLKEFEIRLESYEKLDSNKPEERRDAELAIRALWMDSVDIKKGRGSINMLTQQLQFVTLRDAFMQVKNEEALHRMDLNDRVKFILGRKFHEYLLWRDRSHKELKKRFEIEKSYLKSQIDSLKLYTKWAKPYFKAAQQLGMKDFNSPHIVHAFNNMIMELSIFGKKEIKPERAHPDYANLTLPVKLYACIEVDFSFRTVPQALRAQSGTHYIHGGKAQIKFRPYVFTEEDIEEIEKQELYEDMSIVENLTDVSLKELQDDLDHYLKGDKDKEPKKKSTIFDPFIGVFGGFKEMFVPLTKTKEFITPPKRTKGISGFQYSQIKDAAKEFALSKCLLTYDIYKKAHGMVTW